MDKCREAFEKWKKQEPQASNGYNAAMAWQHQQKRIDELQARIDSALKIADELEQSFEMYKTGIELRKILQGGGEV